MTQRPTDPIENYNYAAFQGDENYLAFRNAAAVGTRAPDFTATLLETGSAVRLSEYWRDGNLLVEFGSLT